MDRPEAIHTALLHWLEEEERKTAVRLEFPIFSLNPGLRPRCMAPDVWPTLSRA